jgi:hypothetical protein
LTKHYHLEEGDVISITDLGDSAILLTPRDSELARLIDRTAAEVAASGTNLEGLLAALDEERAHFRVDWASSNGRWR